MAIGNPTIYLASSSPRRRELLSQLGIEFAVIVPDVPEQQTLGESPRDYVRRVALDKARAGLEMTSDPALPVLGADTAVVLDGEVFGKPVNADDAARMLGRLAGRSHQVISAVALVDEQRRLVCDQTSVVSIVDLDAAAIAAYCRTEEPLDKAGAYAIQGLAAAFVSRLEGSYSGVMGLPLCETVALLGEFGVSGADTLSTLFGQPQREARSA